MCFLAQGRGSRVGGEAGMLSPALFVIDPDLEPHSRSPSPSQFCAAPRPDQTANDTAPRNGFVFAEVRHECPLQ